ncbi:MAG: GTPase domain-containing protein [Nitrospiraceae bacterium]|nr:GTPase domain-containing protein [Nitrospiraceae bacterium]
MALFNYASKELTLKIVYYGPGLSGKTTNIQHLHRSIQPEKRGKLLCLATETDRTLFFDFLPVNLGKVNDFDVKFQLYTVPGQIRYNSTRRLVLKGADAVVFVADSQREMKEDNKESFEGMMENLRENGLDPGAIPIVLQYNKRDLSNIMPMEELDADLNLKRYPVFPASAVNGRGVDETFKAAMKILLEDLARRQSLGPEALGAGAGKTPQTAKKKQAANTDGPFPSMEDEIERFGQDMVICRKPRDNGASAPNPAHASAVDISPANAASAATLAPEGRLEEKPRELVLPEDIRNTLEYVRGALSSLDSKLETLGSQLKTMDLELKAQGSELKVMGSELKNGAASQPDPETGKRMEEIRELVSALNAEISNLFSLKSALQSDRDQNKKDSEKTAAQTDELIALARETKLIGEESLSCLKQLLEPRGKRKKGLSRLFGR